MIEKWHRIEAGNRVALTSQASTDTLTLSLTSRKVARNGRSVLIARSEFANVSEHPADH